MADIPNDTQDAASRAAHVRSFAKDMERISGKKPKNMTPVLEPMAVAPPPKPVAPPPPPPKPAPEPIPLPPLSVQEDIKENVLERLRAKIKEHKNDAPPAPVLRPLGSGPIPLTKPAVIQPNAPIHTYKSDFADHIDEQGASVFSVLAAEKDASGEEARVVLKEKRSGRVKYIVGLMLLLLGAVGVYAAYRWSHNLSVVPTETAVPSLVFADARRELSGTGKDLLDALARVATEELPQGNVLITYVTTSTTTKDGVLKFPQPGSVLIESLALPAPDILLRNIASESTVGVIHAGAETRPFFILRVTSYERTFAGMLDWEKTMPTDLATLYPAFPEETPVVVATTTATSTPIATSTPAVTHAEPAFIDEVVASRDVRVLRDYKNRTILLYGYRDKSTLIIARDEDAFTQLVQRLASTDAR